MPNVGMHGIVAVEPASVVAAHVGVVTEAVV